MFPKNMWHSVMQIIYLICRKSGLPGWKIRNLLENQQYKCSCLVFMMKDPTIDAQHYQKRLISLCD